MNLEEWERQNFPIQQITVENISLNSTNNIPQPEGNNESEGFAAPPHSVTETANAKEQSEKPQFFTVSAWALNNTRKEKI